MAAAQSTETRVSTFNLREYPEIALAVGAILLAVTGSADADSDPARSVSLTNLSIAFFRSAYTGLTIRDGIVAWDENRALEAFRSLVTTGALSTSVLSSVSAGSGSEAEFADARVSMGLTACAALIIIYDTYKKTPHFTGKSIVGVLGACSAIASLIALALSLTNRIEVPQCLAIMGAGLNGAFASVSAMYAGGYGPSLPAASSVCMMIGLGCMAYQAIYPDVLLPFPLSIMFVAMGCAFDTTSAMRARAAVRASRESAPKLGEGQVVAESEGTPASAASTEASHVAVDMHAVPEPAPAPTQSLQALAGMEPPAVAVPGGDGDAPQVVGSPWARVSSAFATAMSPGTAALYRVRQLFASPRGLTPSGVSAAQRAAAGEAGAGLLTPEARAAEGGDTTYGTEPGGPGAST